ncbi:MOSC domain-containing protein [Deinococcus yavapaiensis KR-236]|uniref:MOSC domain-containing protein n=2 Tax=Deinococcus TaxID=1298 RepID=A0A318S2W2_9DEIO|nr:MOSC domain-containing protein [Deinococcus yavapaiensis KR-236]
MTTLPRAGRIERVLVRTRHRGPMRDVPETQAIVGVGLHGDHRDAKTPSDAKRQVTLIQAEHFPVMIALAARDVTPEDLRRNLVVSGINLLALKDERFYVGSVLLQGTGPCHPCSRMEENLGEGGYNVVRGHGGITARVLEGGVLRVGDVVRPA